ncbi:calponin homology domain-containing protein [Coniella lustricola]|uniref:Calponin homology domain-containing protein n=1 Tax=Coniella lustricola TaxID=2025994 RepID=A0A2T2ZT08_9PEZI|nr:calponin homology domain-containing protein [Coniella lustricola]
MGESRQELLSWMNSLLQLNMTKVEQCGTGAALCQIYDSIFQDVPMSRVKFNVNSEYAYIQNFKVLQNTFAKHQIDKTVPVQALVKCKMQDNLEFLQWTKRFWDQYYPGGDYDAVSRRKGAAVSGGPGAAAAAGRVGAGSAAARRVGGSTPSGGARLGVAKAGGGAASAALQAENNTLKETVAGLERERDFYFSKLRDIELLVQQAVEEDPELEKHEDGLIKQIQMILYSTEEGFEIPAEGEEEEADDQETF